MGRAAAPLSRQAVGALARRPGLWPTALRQAWALAPERWWRRRPPSPLPSPAYLRFRLQTQYGEEVHPADGTDLLQYLEWCRAERSARRGQARSRLRARRARR